MLRTASHGNYLSALAAVDTHLQVTPLTYCIAAHGSGFFVFNRSSELPEYRLRLCAQMGPNLGQPVRDICSLLDVT